MAVTTAPGFPQQSGILIPEIWSGKLLVKFYDATVFGAIANTDYEGDISKQGDKVIIRTTPSIVIKDYAKGQTLDYETPEPDTTELLIDRAKYWAFVADDIDQRQADIEFVEDWTEDASEQLKIAIDSQILGAIFTDASADNQGATAGRISGDVDLGVTGSPLSITKTNVTDIIVNMGQVLDEQNVPENGRYLVVPPWFCALIKKSDLKDASLSGDGVSILRNGRVGMVDRFTIYMSNLLARTVDGPNTVTNMIFGQTHGLSFASQLIKNESLRAERTFGQLFRGLQVYGFEVLKPEAMGWLYGYRG